MNKPGINGHVGRFPTGFQFSKIFATLDWVPKKTEEKTARLRHDGRFGQ